MGKGLKEHLVEIVAAPIGYIMKVNGNSVSFESKPYAALTGSTA